jgi:uncharacterized protein (DUF952 family)
MIYHLVTGRVQPNAAGDYCPPSLEAEGFIHFSYGHQVAWVANQFLGGVENLWAAQVDPNLLGSSLRIEDAGFGEKFPHLYRPLPAQSISRFIPLVRSESGQWVFDPAV